MTIAEMLLPEMDHENGVTRRVLTRVPDDRHDWKPHDRSFTLGQLAAHIANLPVWGRITLETTELELDSPDVEALERAATTSGTALLARFDEETARFRAALAAASDPELFVPWTLKKVGASIFTMPRVSVLRTMVINHAVHHRGQLSVYLRMLDVPVPAIYGPSADES